MNDAYSALYRDAHGEERTTLHNDGKALRMTVRGVEFTGDSLDALEPAKQDNPQMATFTLDKWNDLVAGTIIFDIFLPIVTPEGETTANLTVQVDLEGATGRDAGQYALPRLTLSCNGARFSSASIWGIFEAELLRIQRQLPSDTYMKCCFNCAYAGYSPSGDGLWGMYCHRNHKTEYLAVQGHYLEWHHAAEWYRLKQTAIDIVQEIYLCPEFDRWDGRSGYRDPLML